MIKVSFILRRIMHLSFRYLVVFLIVFSFNCSSGKNTEIKVAFWNVENLFDLEDNPLTNDDEFAIGGRKSHTQEILDLKIDHLKEVIDEIDADIFGFCEVENMAVCDILNASIKDHRYKIIHYDSPDKRGIDNVLFYNPKTISILESLPIRVPLQKGGKTRDILYVKGIIAGIVIHIFVNHWPSNYGGKTKAIPKRAKTAAILKDKIEEILTQNPNAEILVMGDLNEDPTDVNVLGILNSTLSIEMAKYPSHNLYNLMVSQLGKEKTGTYVYRGKDLFYDQILVSPGLLDSVGLAVASISAEIHDLPKYRQQEGKYTHYPFRFWAGNRLLGGYSDHLAVYTKIIVK
jgi:predicted extracellular nuclease